MTLCDTGPLNSILNSRDSHHARVMVALRNSRIGQMVTTLPCLCEAFYFLGKILGHPGQDRIYHMLDLGSLSVDSMPLDELVRMRTLMSKYADSPMDFADASLVAIAERLQYRTILTLDRHFYAYLIDDVHNFVRVPV